MSEPRDPGLCYCYGAPAHLHLGERVAMPGEPEADDVMPCGCCSGSCSCDSIDRDWDAYEERRDPVLDMARFEAANHITDRYRDRL
jgi:hypothetical protein